MSTRTMAMARDECKYCQAPILWATQSTGGRLPLNLDPERITGVSKGPFFILNEFEMICTKADVGVIEQAIQEQRALYSNHLVSCSARQERAA